LVFSICIAERLELAVLDHMPVVATYAVNVEVFSGMKLQRALKLMNTQVETEEWLCQTSNFVPGK
jgi:hypothetical protein